MSTDDLKEASWESLRPSVRRFAFHMEAILRRNDHKPGWENDALPDLWYQLEEETKELADAIMVPERSSGSRIRDEAVDVANYAMMIFDNTLPGPMPNPCAEVGPPTEAFEQKKSALALALAALRRFNSTSGADCLGFCFYIHDKNAPHYMMSAWAPKGSPTYETSKHMKLPGFLCTAAPGSMSTHDPNEFMLIHTCADEGLKKQWLEDIKPGEEFFTHEQGRCILIRAGTNQNGPELYVIARKAPELDHVPAITMKGNEAYWAGKPEYIGSLKNLDDATLKGRRGTRLGVTDHKPNIIVTGLAQARDVEKVLNKDFTIREFIPKETHYLLHLEAPTGKFDAEVTKKVWDEHVLPAWQTIPMHCDVATANLEGVTKMEMFSSPFEEWWSKEGWDATAESKAAMKEAFEAGRKSVLGELDPKDER